MMSRGTKMRACTGKSAGTGSWWPNEALGEKNSVPSGRASRMRAAIERLCIPGVLVRECEAGRAGAAELEWIRARLAGDVGNFVITVVPRRLDLATERDSSGDYASGVAARFDPTGRRQ